MNKTLMIVGAGIEQVPAYIIAKKRGLYVVGTDINPNAPAAEYADELICVSTKDADATMEAAANFNASRKIDGVITIANDVPYTVARVSEGLGLNSISIKSAKCASNKLIMKQTFLKNNVSCPWFSEIKSLKELEQNTKDRHKQSYVLKPIDGSGARGVILIDDQIDLKWAFNESLNWSNSKTLILEKFINGTQLSTESFIYRKKCFTPAISERNYSKFNDFKPYIIEDGGTIPALVSKEMHKNLCELIYEGAKAMGIHEGIIKGDLVIDENGKPFIIELAARLSGGWFATHQIPIATGVNLVDIVISHALNEHIDEKKLIPTHEKATAIRYWFPEPGKIESIHGSENIKSLPGIIKYDFFREIGDIQPKVLMHPDRFGYVLFEGKDRNEAIKRAQNAIKSIKINTKKL